MFDNFLFLSPGLILSGEYPQKKSTLYFNPECFSIIGMQSSSVHPGYTVDSYTTILPFFILLATKIEASFRGLKSGLLFFF